MPKPKSGRRPVLRGVFASLSDFAEIEYLCTNVYNTGGESGFAWNDPQLAIPWPVKDPVISGKDAKAQTFA